MLQKLKMMKKTKVSTIRSIRQHSRHLVRELDVLRAEYLDTGCTFSQCHVLFELSREPMGLMELAGNLLMDKSNTSRLVKKLVQDRLVKETKSLSDSRQKIFSLTLKGKEILEEIIGIAEHQVDSAMSFLTEDEQQQAIRGIKLYAQALKMHRLQNGFRIRSIKRADNPAVASIIREVMTEFGAVGEGYSIGDPEVDDMYGNYRGDKSCYYVIENDERIVGGGGIGPLKGGGRKTCELQKMFFLSEIRGLGLGRSLLQKLIENAKLFGYKQCYLETLDRMNRAVHLYTKFGFKELKKPMGNTGHCACDRWFKLDL